MDGTDQAQPWQEGEETTPPRGTEPGYEPTEDEEVPNIPGVTPSDDPSGS